MAVDRDRVAALVRELLDAIGEDPDRPGLRQTPQRVADAYAEFFAGVGVDAAAPLAHTISVSRGPAPDTLPSGAVMLRDIRFRSFCEHHLLPFAGHAHIGGDLRDQTFQTFKTHFVTQMGFKGHGKLFSVKIAIKIQQIGLYRNIFAVKVRANANIGGGHIFLIIEHRPASINPIFRQYEFIPGFDVGGGETDGAATL